MSKITFIGGDYIENIGCSKKTYVQGSHEVHSSKQIIQTATNGISFGKPDDAPVIEKNEVQHINGHFYNEDGTFEGKVDEKTNTGDVSDVYTCTGKGKAKDKASKEIDVYNGIKLIMMFGNNLSHSDLLIYAGIVHGEATNQNSTDVGILLDELRKERYCFANAIYNFMKLNSKEEISQLPSNFSYAKKDRTPAYKFVIDSTSEERNNQWIKTAIKGVINAVTDGKDYSNGATHWDGPDVMTGNFASGYDSMEHFRQSPLNGDEYRVQGIYDKNKLSVKFHDNATKYYTKYDTQRAPHLKELVTYQNPEHYDGITIDPNDKKLKLQSGDSKKDISYNKKNTILIPVSGTGVYDVLIKCLWEVKATSACSIFYKQLNTKY